MSVISLLNEQLKNNLNKSTKELLFSISKNFNVPYEYLLNSWNNINPEFKTEYRKIVIEDDEVHCNNNIAKPKKQLIIED
jgi:hypothetical protein